MNSNGQYVNIICIEQACKELVIDYDFHDRNKNVLSIEAPFSKLFFANSSTPFNSHSIARICEDKEFTQNIIKNEVNMPHSLAFFDPKANQHFNIYKTYDSHRAILEKILKSFTLPVIIKKNSGRQGQNVFLCHTEIDIQKALVKIYNQKSVKYDYVLLAQEYIKPKTEYRLIFYKHKLLLAYEKNIDNATFTNNLSPLHWTNSKAIEITNKDVLKKLNDFCQPVFKSLPIVFAGFDIIEDHKGKFWLLEINTSPGFDHFIKDNGSQKIISIYKYMIGDFISLLNTKQTLPNQPPQY